MSMIEKVCNFYAVISAARCRRVIRVRSVMNDLQILLLTLIVGSTLGLLLYISRAFKNTFKSESEDEPVRRPAEKPAVVSEEKDDEPQKSSPPAEQHQPVNKLKLSKKPKKPPNFTHEWLKTNLKGHSGRVLDLSISSNGKYVASTSDDRSVIIWFFKDFDSKEHKHWRGNVEFDHGTRVSWSPDSKAYAVLKSTGNFIEVYKITKRESGPPSITPVQISFKPVKYDVIAMEVSGNGKYIMTCSDKSTLIIWSLKGDVLSEIETYHMNINYCAKISPCGRFIATSGFTPDVKVYEVKFSKTGDFIKIDKAFSLTGHSSGVYSFDFNADSSKMVTVSKDGQIRIFDTNVEFSKGQDPSLLSSGPLEEGKDDPDISITLSPDARVCALSVESDVLFYSGLDLRPLGQIRNAHSEPITKMAFDAESKYLITSGDKHIRVFHNVPWKKETIRDLESKLKTANTTAKKELLESQIRNNRDSLNAILGNADAK